MDKGKEQLPEPKEKAIPEEGLPVETVAFSSEDSYQCIQSYCQVTMIINALTSISSSLPTPCQVSHWPYPAKSQATMEPTDIVFKGHLTGAGRKKF